MDFFHCVQLILTALFWNTRFYTRLYPCYHTVPLRPHLIDQPPYTLLGLSYPWPVRVVILVPGEYTTRLGYYS